MTRLFVIPFCAMILIFEVSVVHSAAANEQAQEKRYITENLEVTVRSGKGTQYQIVRMLRSGTPVELLEIDKKTGYTHIKTASGAEGWVLTRFLSRHPSSKKQLTKLKERLTQIEIKYKQQKKELENALTRGRSAAGSNQELQKEKSSLARELQRIKQAAASTLAIDNENKSLKQRLISNEHQMQAFQQENQVLKSSNNRKWFLYGGGFGLLCIILGLVIPHMSWKRKSSWRSF